MKLLFIQLATIGSGLLILLAVYQLSEKAQLDASISRLKEQIAPAIAARQEQWRAWSMLGLNDALNEEIAAMQKQFPMAKISVIAHQALPTEIPASAMVFPANSKDDDNSVLVELSSSQVDDVSHAKMSVLIALGSVSILFIGIILFSGRYIYRRVYAPILELNRVLSRQKTDFTSVSAVGEMRDLVDTLSATLEKSIAENNRLAQEAAFGVLAKSIAHDIRSPLSALNVLLAYSEALPSDQKSLMRSAVTRIDQIAEGLLQRSRKYDSKRVVSAESISALVTSAVAEKKLEKTGTPNLGFELKLVDEQQTYAYVDRVQFTRVMSNILNNSIEAHATLISIDVSVDANDVCLFVSDNGKGMPPEVLKKLRTENISFDKPGGNGLGLLSLRTMSEHCNFKYDMSSSVGRGTMLSLRLRRAESQKIQPTLA